jgi:hypothetical protein
VILPSLFSYDIGPAISDYAALFSTTYEGFSCLKDLVFFPIIFLGFAAPV